MRRAAVSGNGEQKQRGGGDLQLPAGVSVESIQTELEKILASEIFARAERLSRFLRFAVEQTIQGHGEQIKEYVLGLEVFDRNESYDPRIDPIVRVEAARLRTKLKEYYEKEGLGDPVLIQLSKGSYVPHFQKQRPPVSKRSSIRQWTGTPRDLKSIALVTSLVLLAVATYWIAALSQRNLSLHKEIETVRPQISLREYTPIWGRFFSPDAENFVVFGSPVFFTSQSDTLFLRFSTVNDPTDLFNDANFQMLQRRFGPLSGPRYDYTEMGNAIALQRLAAFFGSAGGKFTALPAHLATWDSVKDGNIIFLGAPRMNPLLQNLPVQQDFEWGPDHNIYNRNPLPGEQETYITPSHRDTFTFAVVASFPGLQPDREILLLTAHNTPGTLAAVEQVTRLENVRAMTERLKLGESGERKHYQLLLRVVADKNAPVKTEYVTYHISRPRANKP